MIKIENLKEVNVYALPGIKNEKLMFPRRSVAASVIIRAVCEINRVSEDILMSKTRVKSVCIPRQIAYYLLRKYTMLSLYDIGKLFCDRDHSIVHYGIGQIDMFLRNKDEEITRLVLDIENRF